MPFINVKTNSKKVNDSKVELKAALGQSISAIPGKIESWLMVSIDDASDMWFQGSPEPCAMFEVSIYSTASDSDYDELTKRICKISEYCLDVPADRTYVKYIETEHWGWNNVNF